MVCACCNGWDARAHKTKNNNKKTVFFVGYFGRVVDLPSEVAKRQDYGLLAISINISLRLMLLAGCNTVHGDVMHSDGDVPARVR